MPVTIKLAPADKNILAIAKPIPLVAPVIRAVLPFKLIYNPAHSSGYLFMNRIEFGKIKGGCSFAKCSTKSMRTDKSMSTCSLENGFSISDFERNMDLVRSSLTIRCYILY